MKQLIACVLFCTLLLASCSKNKEEVNGDVLVRIQNASNLSLENVMVGDAVFGNTLQGTVTEYKKVTTPIYSGFCNYELNGQSSWAGYGICGTPMPPPFEAGRYTFRIEQVGQGYLTVIVTKD